MSLSAQQQQLQQLQMLQQQLIQQSAMLQHPQQQMQQPLIDSNLLAQIQALTNQLLQKTQDEAKPPEPTFNKVCVPSAKLQLHHYYTTLREKVNKLIS